MHLIVVLVLLFVIIRYVCPVVLKMLKDITKVGIGTMGFILMLLGTLFFPILFVLLAIFAFKTGILVW